MNNVSETNLVNYTTRVRFDAIKLFVSTQLADGMVVNSKIADGAVTGSKLATASVTESKIGWEAVNSAQIGPGAVLTAKIADGAVTEGKLGALAVTSGKIGVGAVIAGKIATGGVSAAAQFAAQVVDTTALKDANVTGVKIGWEAVNWSHLATGAVLTAKIADGAVTQAKLGVIKRMIMVPVFWFEDLVTVKDFTRIMAWHPDLDGHIVTGAWAALLGHESTSGSVVLNLINAGGTMATISIGAGAWSAQSGAISGSYDDVASLATFSVNVTSAGTGAKGLMIYLEVSG